MIDDETNLRERFAQLRAEERRAVPRFAGAMSRRRRPIVWRAVTATAALALLITLAVTLRPKPTSFSDSDRAAVRSVAAWQPPTDFLLRTPDNELLTTTPRIPDLKGIQQ